MDPQQTPTPPTHTEDEDNQLEQGAPVSAPGSTFQPTVVQPEHEAPSTDVNVDVADLAESEKSSDTGTEPEPEPVAETEAPEAPAPDTPETSNTPDAPETPDIPEPSQPADGLMEVDHSDTTPSPSETPEATQPQQDVPTSFEPASTVPVDQPATPTFGATQPGLPSMSETPAQQPPSPTPSAFTAPDLSDTQTSSQNATPDTMQTFGATPSDAALAAGAAAPVAAAVVGGKSKKRTLKLISLIAGAIIVLGSASAAAYFGYYMPNQPKYVVARAIGNMLTTDKLKSASIDGEFSTKDKTSNQTYSGTISGKSGQKGFDLTTSLDLSVTKANVELLTADGKTAYLKVSGLDGLPELLQSMGSADADSSMLATMYAPLIKQINGQWIEIDQQLLANFGQSQLLSTATARLNDADAQKVKDAYRKHSFLEVPKVYADQKINGITSRHYQVKINKQELHDFLADLKTANIKSIQITNDELTSVSKSNLDKYPAEIWIAKDTNLVDQISFSVDDKDGSAGFRFALGNINKPMTITKPASTKTLLQVIGNSDLFSGMSSDMTDMSGMSNTGMTTSTNPLGFKARVL